MQRKQPDNSPPSLLFSTLELFEKDREREPKYAKCWCCAACSGWLKSPAGASLGSTITKRWEPLPGQDASSGTHTHTLLVCVCVHSERASESRAHIFSQYCYGYVVCMTTSRREVHWARIEPSESDQAHPHPGTRTSDRAVQTVCVPVYVC